MKLWALTGSIAIAWSCSAVFCGMLWLENVRLREERQNDYIQKSELTSLLLSLKTKGPKNDWDIFGLEDMNYFRSQGKIDGKVEALLVMNSTPLTNISQDQIDKILEVAEKAPQSEDGQFLSLLCRAAYHKGMTTGEQNAREDIDKQYENGYHAAIDDFTCPETGKIVIPQNAKENLKMKKP